MRSIAAAFVAALSLAACSVNGAPSGGAGSQGGASEGASSSQAQLKDVSFMLYWAPDTNHIGVYVAKNKGWFEQEGLNVEILGLAQAGAEQAVNSGLTDFALSTLTNVGLYNAKGASLKGVLQVQQKPSAIWCALESNKAIASPKDFDGKTFATFGSSESDAVIRQMIRTDGGRGIFDTVTVGTSTFNALTSGRADFGGFYDTWEGVQSRLNDPELTCFSEPEYGVPGNADSISIITNENMIERDPHTVKAFVSAAQRGYEYAYAHPDEAAQILVEEAAQANLDPQFVRESMAYIVDGEYWGDREAIEQGSFTLGSTDTGGVQSYLDFLTRAGAIEGPNGEPMDAAPDVVSIATDEFIHR